MGGQGRLRAGNEKQTSLALHGNGIKTAKKDKENSQVSTKLSKQAHSKSTAGLSPSINTQRNNDNSNVEGK
jgi:hypothetical protein